MRRISRRAIAVVALLLLAALTTLVRADVGGSGDLLPAGTELNDDALYRPRELFRSERRGGRKSYRVNLGDMAFNSPRVLGGLARQAGISCATCHVNGTSNPRFYIPGLSLRPGTFDTTGALFNPKADDGVLDPVTIPSLRGARFLAPYGHDGRSASLRDFVRNVIVNEFSGPEPSPEIADALVAYVEDIDFLPNHRLAESGKLQGRFTDAERRGEALFYKPFRHDPSLSCAGCHIPSGAFVDHRQHDIGSEGLFKTPTLLNANANAPYFHDGRYRSYAEVVAHFDRMFYLGLSAQDRQDLVAYLQAIGDAEQPYVQDGVDLRLQEIVDFATVLDTAVPAHNEPVVALAVDTVGGELRELAEHFPERKSTVVTGGRDERAKARAALKELALGLREVDSAAHDNRFADAAQALTDYRTKLTVAMPLLKAAEPWSLFNPQIHAAHVGALRQLYRAAADPRLAAPRHVDLDD